MNDSIASYFGAALLRVSLGAMFLAHSIVLKVMTYGFAGTSAFFESIGLPGVVAYAVIAAELVGGALLLLDIRTRFVALALVPILAGATWVHAGNGWVFTSAGGGWEYPVFLIAVSLVVALQARPRAATSVTRAATAVGAV